MHKKVLIIDDDIDLVDSMKMFLETKYDVLVKYDVKNLVDSVKTFDPDIILLDVMFPEDSDAGFKAARDLAADKETVGIPVLILSAVNKKSDMGFTFSESDISDSFMPVQGFVDKPVEPAVLIEMIENALS